ncbi:protein NO VEIN domain-containing protein [Malacoplasma iowae]|uniref:DUF3883 domain-containing protein n=1 Tax=Malacoplasma iowae 695 TaxID=1048830 RepID=A0A6P1LKI8_MALIO|nr:DUF3883 domain-containing protein [Malacoplasma iowae]QHG89433.1 DUF3883 domain-containing protein [Malacoplasma iowae 695]WPL35846.1 DUF3883 domain-containing protein [Malacoplasma iowae]VEU62886.1 Uncharacterised protein [Mycoplasmopsis fermentans]VEU71639.1 Uncharacterised protein [Malacoplasma iowae]
MNNKDVKLEILKNAFPWIDEVFDLNLNISKSYILYDNTWKVPTFEPQFYGESIYSYIFKNTLDITVKNIEDCFLLKSQAIKKNQETKNINFKNAKSPSNAGNISNLIRVFKVRKQENDKDNINKLTNIRQSYSKEDFINGIEEWINYIINTRSPKESRRFANKWNNYYVNKAKYKTNEIPDDLIEDYISGNELKNPINNLDDYVVSYSDKTNNFEYKNNFQTIAEKLNNEKIGNIGEILCFKYLQENFKNYKIKRTSEINKFANHDITVKDKDDNIVYYVEVKSSSSNSFPRFYLSKNEYNLYRKNKDKYILVFISGINIYQKDEYVPEFVMIKSPEIIVNFDEIGYRDGKLIICPTNYEGLFPIG